MVAYSFQRRFVDPIRSGMKRQTIRKVRLGRSRHAKLNERLQLYCLQRLGGGLIGTAVCQGTQPVRLDFTRNIVFLPGRSRENLGSLDTFARSDGFEDWAALCAFWREHHDVDLFEGTLIRWACFEPAEARS